MEKLCSPLDDDCFVFVEIDTPELRVRTFQNRKHFFRSARLRTTAKVTRKLPKTHRGWFKTKSKGMRAMSKTTYERAKLQRCPGKPFYRMGALEATKKNLRTRLRWRDFSKLGVSNLAHNKFLETFAN